MMVRMKATPASCSVAGKPLQQDVPRRHPPDVGHPEVRLHHVAEEAGVLHRQRPVQPHVLLHLLVVGLGGLGTEQVEGGVSGQVHAEKHRQAQDHQRNRRLTDPDEYISLHDLSPEPEALLNIRALPGPDHGRCRVGATFAPGVCRRSAAEPPSALRQVAYEGRESGDPSIKSLTPCPARAGQRLCLKPFPSYFSFNVCRLLGKKATGIGLPVCHIRPQGPRDVYGADADLVLLFVAAAGTTLVQGRWPRLIIENRHRFLGQR